MGEAIAVVGVVGVVRVVEVVGVLRRVEVVWVVVGVCVCADEMQVNGAAFRCTRGFDGEGGRVGGRR